MDFLARTVVWAVSFPVTLGGATSTLGELFNFYFSTVYRQRADLVQFTELSVFTTFYPVVLSEV